MEEKVGRNDPCSCGSGKKFKSCCFQKQQEKKTNPLKGRKFTAKILSSGGAQVKEQPTQVGGIAKQNVDYALLMERAFGDAMHTYESKPPIPEDPSKYLVKDKLE